MSAPDQKAEAREAARGGLLLLLRTLQVIRGMPHEERDAYIDQILEKHAAFLAANEGVLLEDIGAQFVARTGASSRSRQ